MMRIRIGLVVTFSLLGATAAGPVSIAAAASAVPQAGDWEGTGGHGLPLSFELVRQGGRLLATGLAVGYPASCPAVARDAQAVPFDNPLYAGPDGRSTGAFTSSPPAVLAGQIPGSKQQIFLSGSFATSRTGSFSIKTSKPIGCGWPATTLTWSVHRSNRRPVADGTWTGSLNAPGLINGNVRLVVGAQGRAVNSFTSFFTCVTDTQQGNTIFRAVPAYDFVRPGGGFYSPLNGGLVRGHATTWAGTFSPSGQMSGTLHIFDDCTNQLITAHFTGRRTKA